MAAATKKPAKKASGKPLTQSETIKQLAERSGLAKKDVVNVLDQLSQIVLHELAAHGSAVLLRLVKLKVVRVPARPAGEFMNPFTKQMAHREAQPARNKAKAFPLKTLKDSVA